MSLLLALLRHADGHSKCLFIGVDRKSSADLQKVALDPKATLARLSWTGRSASGGETAMTLEVLQSDVIERVNRFGPSTPKLVYACGVRAVGGAWMVGAAAARRSERLRVRGG